MPIVRTPTHASNTQTQLDSLYWLYAQSRAQLEFVMYDKRIRPLKPKQQRDKPLLPMFLVEDPSSPSRLILIDVRKPVQGTCKKVGDFVGRGTYGTEQKYEAIEVHYGGWIIPCYRLNADYVICQNYLYRAVKEPQK